MAIFSEAIRKYGPFQELLLTERNRTEEVLRASEERYRRMVEMTQEGICTVDSEGRFTFSESGPGCAALLGFAPGALPGMQMAEVWVPEDVAQLHAQIGRRRDGLTGLANRARLHEHLEGSLRAARDIGRPISLLLLDLNRLKQVNDVLGHHIGDLLLRQVADRLQHAW